MKKAIQQWKAEAASETFTPSYVEHLNKLVNDPSALEQGEPITYYEFLNYMTGQTWCSVELYFYDLSKGSGWWWTPVLFGHAMPCVWHCGVVAFEKEYRYGGNIFESNPGCTAFGTPQKKVKIGSTCRSRQDVLSFINRRLTHTFAPDSYQVLSNNSNHFCDALTMFLINKHISSEVLQQPELIMGSQVAQSLSQWLPWLKGKQVKEVQVTLKEQAEWDSIKKDTIVNYEYEDGWTLLARVTDKKEHSCDLQWYNRKDGQLHITKGVSRQALQPADVGDPLYNRSLPQRKL